MSDRVDTLFPPVPGLDAQDVVCGNSIRHRSHAGNKEFRRVICVYYTTYHSATSKREKTEVKNLVVRAIHLSGGRFVKISNGTSIELLRQEAICRKVVDAFKTTRDKLRVSLPYNPKPYPADAVELLRYGQATNIFVDALLSLQSVLDAPKIVSVKDVPIGQRGAERFSDALQNNPICTDVALSNNNLNVDSLKIITNGVAACPNISFFSIENNKSIGCHGIRGMAQALVHSKVRILMLWNNRLDDDSAKALAEELLLQDDKHCIKELFLTRNQIGPVGCQSLAPALKCLTFLSIDQNNIGSRGASSLATELRSNDSPLQTIHLYGNDIGNSGATELCQALATKSSLREINLSCNGIDNAGAIAMAKALKNANALEVLNLMDNSIGWEGVKELVCVFRDKCQNTGNRKEGRIFMLGLTGNLPLHDYQLDWINKINTECCPKLHIQHTSQPIDGQLMTRPLPFPLDEAPFLTETPPPLLNDDFNLSEDYFSS